MYQDIRLHGHINDTIEYFATAAARDIFRGCFYEASGGALRLFAPGNEFLLDRQGISHRGNGGAFCEYMFGVDMPLADLAKTEVRNRLVLFGATLQEGGTLLFTDYTEGRQDYEQIFFEGNAVSNYYFFLTGSVAGSLREQQEGILRLLGRVLKRSAYLEAGDEANLTEDLFGLLGHRSALYLVKLIHKKHRLYQETFRSLYGSYRAIPDEEYARLEELAESLGIDKYQQERIRIDVMYKDTENRRIVDEYKNILLECNRQGCISAPNNARLTRLKTLSVRNKIPAGLFYTLDEMLRHDSLSGPQEQDYLAEARQILAGIFLQEQQIQADIDQEDMIKLLHAKRRASENRDYMFEQILLETGKACDEKIRDGADIALLEAFSYIVTFFDRYDTTSTLINQLAFMENVRISEDLLRSLLGNKRAFDGLSAGFFDQLFFTGVLENKYLGRYGRKKLLCLRRGITEIEEGRRTVQDLLGRLLEIGAEERLYGVLLSHIKERMRNLYSRYATRAEQETLHREINEELRQKGLVEGTIPLPLFRDVVVNIKKEAIYLHTLLPQIVAGRDASLREDFLENSGLDRFYVEELERDYFTRQGLDSELLQQLHKGSST